jgi:hypothetical protein
VTFGQNFEQSNVYSGSAAWHEACIDLIPETVSRIPNSTGQNTMNAIHTDSRLATFVARLLQSAASEAKKAVKPSAHDLAMAYGAAFAARKVIS